MAAHELKTIQPYFNALASGEKTFEIRKNDRDFKVGDLLWLREYDPDTDWYPGSSIQTSITYITDYAQRQGYVVLALKT